MLLESSWVCVATWKITGCEWVPARISWGTTAWPTKQGQDREIFFLGTVILCVTILAVLLVMGGVKINPGRCVVRITHLLFSGCDRNHKSGTQCDTCGICDERRSKRFRLLEKRQNALLQIDLLRRKKSYDYRQVEMKLSGRIRYRVILKVDS
jgi:hypothetical protein